MKHRWQQQTRGVWHALAELCAAHALNHIVHRVKPLQSTTALYQAQDLRRR